MSERPTLASRFRLQFEPVQNAHVLLYPEGMIKLNRSAYEILQRCDGQRNIAELVTELELAFDKPGLTREVNQFIAAATTNGWLNP